MEHTIETPAAEQQRQATNRSLWILLIGVVVLLFAGIATAVVVSRGGPAVKPAGTPTGTIQRYMALLQNGEVDRAYAMTSRWEDRRIFHDEFDSWSQSSHRVTLVRSTVDGSNAAVTVDISSFSGGPFGAAEDTNRVTFPLMRHGKRWLVTGSDYLP
ncbi:MAG TPA: hypothetical protein VF221_16750 [Chloroflexota bacterium]